MTTQQRHDLYQAVLGPLEGDDVGVLTDQPTEAIPDTPAWIRLRATAARWCADFKGTGARSYSLFSYPATGSGNADLPNDFMRDGSTVENLETLASSVQILFAITRFSATAPLLTLMKRFRHLRVVSMPNLSPESEEGGGLTADYKEVQRNCSILMDHVRGSSFASLEFSTGDRLRLDLRDREPIADDGYLHRDKLPPRLINLPSGECFVSPNDLNTSESEGVLPIVWGDAIVRLQVASNQVVAVIGSHAAAQELRQFLDDDPARKNIAELGLGCNPKARVSNNILESEKAGPHIALGRSDHLGGTVGPDRFRNPAWHHDFVYAPASAIQIVRLQFSSQRSSLTDSTGRYHRDSGIVM